MQAGRMFLLCLLYNLAHCKNVPCDRTLPRLEVCTAFIITQLRVRHDILAISLTHTHTRTVWEIYTSLWEWEINTVSAWQAVARDTLCIVNDSDDAGVGWGVVSTAWDSLEGLRLLEHGRPSHTLFHFLFEIQYCGKLLCLIFLPCYFLYIVNCFSLFFGLWIYLN